jgi:alanyl-tRNA synthetase
MDTAAAVERMQKELYALRGRVAELEEGDFARKAELYADKGNVLLFEGEMSADSVRKLCDAVLRRCGGRCAVFAGSDGNYKYAIGEDGGDLRAFVKEMNAALNGRGGGRDGFAQGSVACTEAEIRAFFGGEQ